MVLIYKVHNHVLLTHFFTWSSQRYEIVNGVVEVGGVAKEADVDQGGDKSAEGITQELKYFIHLLPFPFVLYV